jgi:exoribonuclease R
MVARQIGIFRKTQQTHTVDEVIVSDESRRVIQMWNNNISGQYVIYAQNMNLTHDVMKLKNYVHMTSPIRRLVDLLNQMWFFHRLSEDARKFLDSWMERIDYLNMSMRSIRKIQTDCEVLHRCSVQPEILSIPHKGVIFDRIQKPDGAFVYMVYLEDLRMLSRMKTYTELENHTTHDFQIYLFEDEHSFKKKVRVQYIQ